MAVVAVVAVLAVIGAAVDDGGGGGGGEAGDGTLTAAAQAAGCEPVEEEEVSKGNKHVAGEVDYAVEPPTQGDHSPNTLRNFKRFYSREDNPPIEPAVHNLEHGLVVAWYDDELPADQVAKLEEVSQDMSSRYVAVPWGRSTFEGGRHFVLTAWAVRQRCTTVSQEVVEEFVKAHADTKAPEKGYSV